MSDGAETWDEEFMASVVCLYEGEPPPRNWIRPAALLPTLLVAVLAVAGPFLTG